MGWGLLSGGTADCAFVVFFLFFVAGLAEASFFWERSLLLGRLMGGRSLRSEEDCGASALEGGEEWVVTEVR